MAKNKTSSGKSVKKRKVSFILAVVFLVMACFTVVHFVRIKAEIDDVKEVRDTLSEAYEEQSQENERLEEILDTNDLDEYLERKARDNSYVKPGERVFHDSSAD